MSLEDELRRMIREEAELALRSQLSTVLREQLAQLTITPVGKAVPTSDPALSTKLAARHAGVSEATIRAWAASGRLRAIRAGRVIKVRRSDLDAFLARSGPRGDGVIDLSARAREILSSARRAND